MNKAKESFLKIYPNLPDKIRNEIIAIVEEKTFTWNSAYFEIKNDTETGNKILNNLKELELI